MSLAEETARVAGGGKNTLKTMLQKLGVGVGSERIDQYPTLASQISGKLHPDNLISAATASSLGLAGTATPNEAFAQIKALIDAANANSNTKCRVATGSYVGTGVSGVINPPMAFQFPFKPKFVAVPTLIRPTKGYLELITLNDGGIPALAVDSVPTGPEYSSSDNLIDGPFGRWTSYRYDNNTNTLYFYTLDSNAPYYQLNLSGSTYYWIALG